MRKLKRKTQEGAVTLFLLVIMVPMLTFSFLALDICKIYLAKNVAVEATDLSLNAGLTSYDKVLKDMYGLMATSESAEELTEKMTEYYVATLTSSGLSADDTKGTIQSFFSSLFSTDLSEALGDNDSFLKLFASSPDGNAVSAAPIAVSAVSNPEVMHRQIVEYMKYRGPVYLTAGVLDKINVFKDLDNQTAATSSKLEFEQTLSNLNNEAIRAYCLFQLYFYNNAVLETGSSFLDIPYPNEPIPS